MVKKGLRVTQRRIIAEAPFVHLAEYKVEKEARRNAT